MKAADLRELTVDEIQHRISELYTKLFEVKNKLGFETASNLKEYRSLRQDVARAKTILHEKKGA